MFQGLKSAAQAVANSVPGVSTSSTTNGDSHHPNSINSTPSQQSNPTSKTNGTSTSSNNNHPGSISLPPSISSLLTSPKSTLADISTSSGTMRTPGGKSNGGGGGLKTPKTPADEAIAYFEKKKEGEGEEGGKEEEVKVWELMLEDDGGPSYEKSYIRLPPPTTPYILRITLAPGSVATRNGVLKSDFPMDGGAFERDSWKSRSLPGDVTKSVKVDLPISAPGAFCYFIEYDESYSSENTGKVKRLTGRKGYFNVDPIISLPERTPFFPELKTKSSSHASTVEGSEKGTGSSMLDNTTAGIVKADAKMVNLPLDALAIISIIAKWQGPLTEWDPHYAEASRRGYNFIHYTPLQSRGDSGSPYSISDQMVFDHELLREKKDLDGDGGEAQIRSVVEGAKKKYGLGSLTDVVLNHTSNSSPWLQDHPEAGYSPANSPHLAPALELDNAMIELSGKLSSMGLPTVMNSEGDVAAVMEAVKKVIQDLHLWQYYVLDVASEKTRISQVNSVEEWKGEDVKDYSAEHLASVVRFSGLIDNHRSLGGRFISTVKPEVAAGLIKAARGDEADLAAEWGKVVDIINVDLHKECDGDLQAATEGIQGRLKFTRLDSHGPKMGEISEKSPLIETYFTRLPKTSKTAKHSENALSLANNGWMWAADPLKNFAEEGKAYLRREVIVWGDCVKLRYGKGPEDNPWLWSHMIAYAELLASIFDGFRLDNCHSTPLNVGVKIIDAARAINPNLYIIAELFTGSEEMDLAFVSRIGINSLVREAYNGNDPKDMSRLLYRFGVARAIGSMDSACLARHEELPPPTGRGPIRNCVVMPLRGSAPHAVFYDVTHDNETPYDKRTAEDALSSGALVTFTGAAIGTTKGFDDLYPKLLNLVSDKRKYQVPSQETNHGIGKAKRILNHLHQELASGGYVEGHVHQENDYIVMHRVHPSTLKGYLLIAHTAFNKGGSGRGHINPFKLSGQTVDYIFGASIKVDAGDFKDSDEEFQCLPSTLIEIPSGPIQEGKDENGSYTEIIVPDQFEPGSILLYSTEMKGDFPEGLDTTVVEGAEAAFADLDLIDLNIVLHCADGEERDATGGDGTYDLPGYGQLVYCGFEGWMGPLKPVIQHNDLGHALCAHLRAGPWAMDYIVARLERRVGEFPHLAPSIAWLKEKFDLIKQNIAPFLRPKFFAMVVKAAYEASVKSVIEMSSEFVSSSHGFVHNLALCSVQMYGLVKSASISPSKPVASLAAGLPHFAAGWARCWGRDVFISLRGLFLTTGNFSAAREHILAFGSTLKHGLIPNLLDSTRNPRYNCRDGPWWMIQNIQDYTKMCPNGEALLKDSVKRRFPADDTWVTWDDPKAYAYSNTVGELIQEILQRHAEGIEFREYNAGPNLDMDMTDEGFNQKIWVDWKTGLIHGGNRFNCGTWMDKMGSSDRAGNKGLPATPRDGSPIEITGLLKSTLTWLDGLSKKGQFPFRGVKATIDGKQREISYKEWADLIQASFEKCYWVPETSSEDGQYEINTALVNRRGIYKDVYGTPKDREWADYQFRCNFTLPMIVAPELFDPEHAMISLKLADKHLRGPLGMRTLDPADSAYRGDYDNSNDSTDQAIAKGWNYHQGPEWVFPTGWFLMAYLKFDRIAGEGKTDPAYTFHHVSEILLAHRKHVANDPWRGLPELTNFNGAYCYDSCRTQAWSASTILDVLEEMHRIHNH